MVQYITIDGDDVGNKLAKCFIENDEVELATFAKQLTCIVSQICQYLESQGCDVIICAADGITVKTDDFSLAEFAMYLTSVGQPHLTFSAGIGESLQSAFV